ncbi:MAG: polyprenyl synthetase family protein [Chloroflexi bacterium]|nr:polyprenyl synthetase family protein [Chloroflexota bacterium]
MIERPPREEARAVLEWPASDAVYDSARVRAERLIGEQGPVLAEVARAVLGREQRLLSPKPATLWPIVVARTCASASGDWRHALWPAVGLEVAMAAADLFDDLADGEAIDLLDRFSPGILLTAAVGLLAVGFSAVLRGEEDGCPSALCSRLGRLLGDGIALAVDGQIRSLRGRGQVTDATEAYEIAARKSGPLGELACRIGAMIGTADPSLLDLYGRFGWHLAVAGQLANDAADVLPGSRSWKRDVRDGCPTVPLVYARSTGAPSGLDESSLTAWEEAERQRIVAAGGVLAAETLAIAERLRAEEALTALEAAGRDTAGLRELLTISRLADTGEAGQDER